MMKYASRLGAFLLVLCPLLSLTPPLAAQDDPVVQRIIDLGRTDNRAMEWADWAANRFGGRLTGSDAYINATRWALWQFEQLGIQAQYHPVGALDVGFNRGPWFGRVVAPREISLRFGTPSFTAGTKGLQRGRVVILQADPYSINGRNATPEEKEAKRLAVEEALAEVRADPGAFDGAWVLIAGNSTGFGRDGRRNTPEYTDSELMPPLSQALVNAGAMGTVQRATDPIRILDGHVKSWEELPELPDIKLLDVQYDEIRAMVEAGEAVELEFDIRNWFKMGPVEYGNIVAVIPGTTHPEEWVIMGGHFDSFDGGTGGVDDGSGFSVQMEALRLIKAAGGAPKRSIATILFAAEENGLVGSQAWVRDHPELHDRILVMMNRDGSPSAVTGVSVPPAWFEDFQRIATPLTNLNPRWTFTVTRNDYPGPKPDRPGGSDHASFAMQGIPILGIRTETDYSYNRAWHTLYDLYSELVPYTEHQEHSALATAVLAYGIANLDQSLTREGVYLPDGLYADIITTSGTRIMASLDYRNAPLQAANFVRMVEGDGSRPPAGAGRPGGPGGRATAIGSIQSVTEGRVQAAIESEIQRSVAVAQLPLTPNPAVTHDAGGVLGLSGPNTFYLTLEPNPSLDARFTALGRVVAGAHLLGDLAPEEGIRTIRIVRAGADAQAFATGDEAFQRLLEAARRR